jgi:hypothetical protein
LFEFGLIEGIVPEVRNAFEKGIGQDEGQQNRRAYLDAYIHRQTKETTLAL